MDTRWHRAGLAAVLLGIILSGCGNDEAPGEPPGSVGLTPERLAAALSVPEDLGTGWSVTQLPEFPELNETGLVSDEAVNMLPRLEFCEKADDDAQAAASSLRWVAYRQLDLATDTPTRPPSPGKPSLHHLVFVQEFLTSGEAGEVETTYDALVSGFEACLGTQTTPDGETVQTTAYAPPALGDASHGSRDLVTEPGPRAHRAVWDLRQVLVRDGEVLMMATVAEIASPGVPTVMDEAEVEEILTTMADKLP